MKYITFLALNILIQIRFQNELSSRKIKNSALIIHNIKNFEITHSDLIKSTKKQHKKLLIKTTKEIREEKHKIIQYKEYIYDLIIIIASRDHQILKIAEDLNLVDFYDQGGNLLILSDSVVLQPFRIFLSLFGFDQFIPENLENSLNLTLKTKKNNPKIFIPKNMIDFKSFSKNIKNGIYYSGGGISLTPYENLISWNILNIPPNSLLTNLDNITYQEIDQEKISLVTAAQGMTNLSRMIIVGSFKIFSNEYNNLSEGDNFFFFQNILNWLDFNSNVLNIDYFSICGTDKIECEKKTVFKPYEKIFIKIRILDENGEFYKDEENDIFLRLKMFEIFLQQPFVIKKIGDKEYYTYEFDAFDKIGIYKLSLVYEKPTYFLDAKNLEQEIIFRIWRNEKSQIFSYANIIFLGIIFLVTISFINVVKFSMILKKD